MPSFDRRLWGFFSETNNTGHSSSLVCKYSFKYMLVFSLTYTLLSFPPFPSTTRSFWANCISSRLILDNSDTLTAVEYRNSTIALSLIVLHSLRIFSLSSSEKGFFITFSTLISSTIIIGFSGILFLSLNHPKKLL